MTTAPRAGVPAGGLLDDDEVAALDRWWRAANYLAVGQIYLLDNPLLERRADARGHQAPAARPLGHHAGAEPGLHPPQPADPRARRRRDLPRRTRPRRSGRGRERLAGGHLQRGLPARVLGPGRDARAVPAVLVPRRHPQPRRPGDARLDPRGRRARLRPLPRVRRGPGQPRPAGDRGGRRRRVRDRPAGGLLAREQVPGPGARRRGAAGAAPQRLEDREPDRARADPARGAAQPAARLRARGAHRRGGRPRRRAPPARRRARPGPRHDPGDPAGRARATATSSGGPGRWCCW